MSKLKNKKHELFCREIIKSKFNATQAYRVIYGDKDINVLNVNSSRLLSNAKIKKRIGELAVEQIEKYDMDAAKVFELMVRQATYNSKEFFDVKKEEIEKDGKVYVYNGIYLKNWDDIDGTLIQEIKQTKDGIQIKLPDRQKATEMLGRYYSMFQDNVKVKGDPENPIIITEMTINRLAENESDGNKGE